LLFVAAVGFDDPRADWLKAEDNREAGPLASWLMRGISARNISVGEVRRRCSLFELLEGASLLWFRLTPRSSNSSTLISLAKDCHSSVV
jgi:hypothetical protein